MYPNKETLQKMIRDAVSQGVSEAMETIYEQNLVYAEEMPYDRYEHGYRKTMSWGELPSKDELYELMNGDSFNIKLQGAEELAWEYAIRLAPNPEAGSVSAGSGMLASLEALVNVPAPEELSDEDYEEVEPILELWYSRYKEPIVEAAWTLASSIVENFGIEWI